MFTHLFSCFLLMKVPAALYRSGQSATLKPLSRHYYSSISMPLYIYSKKLQNLSPLLQLFLFSVFMQLVYSTFDFNKCIIHPCLLYGHNRALLIDELL